jgi:hypothetical protein
MLLKVYGASFLYRIDMMKMFWYARRRYLEAEIKTFLEKNTNVVLKYS